MIAWGLPLHVLRLAARQLEEGLCVAEFRSVPLNHHLFPSVWEDLGDGAAVKGALGHSLVCAARPSSCPSCLCGAGVSVVFWCYSYLCATLSLTHSI